MHAEVGHQASLKEDQIIYANSNVIDFNSFKARKASAVEFRQAA